MKPSFTRRSMVLITLAIFIAALLPADARAIRPLYTEDCWVVNFGESAIESGVLLLSRRDDTGFRSITTSYKYGLTRNVDVGIDLPYFSSGSYSSNYDGLSDGTVKLKYNFYCGENCCEGLSFLLGYMVDTADSSNISLATNQHDITTMLIYSKSFGEFDCHFNFGYTFDDNPARSEAEDFIIYNAAIIKPLNDTVNMMAETQYSRNTLTETIINEIAAGFNYLYNANLTFDAALGCGLTEASSSSNLAFGLTYLFI